MEKHADKTEQLLLEKLSLYQDLQRILEEEKEHVVSMDVDSLWVTISKKKLLVQGIEDIRLKIFSLFGEIYSDLNMDTPPFSLTQIIQILNVSSEKKAGLKKIHLAIVTCKNEITRQASENKNFINEFLAIIDGIFSTVLESKDKSSYNHSGSVLKNNGKNRLINAEV